jgi:taurine dioxygenase
MIVTRLNNFFGAEIHGIDGSNLTDEHVDDIKELWLTHKVLVLRDQVLTPEEHVEFSRNFGDLEVHPHVQKNRGDPDIPEILILEAGGSKRALGTDWHSDVTFKEKPPMGSILRGVVTPEVGGDTCFADSTAAFDRLDSETKGKVEKLSATHDWYTEGNPSAPKNKDEVDREKYPLVSHPVIRTHPETKEKGIYTNNFFTSHIDGVEVEESKHLLRKLAGAIRDPSIQIRVRWDEKSVVMWDNRCVQHTGTDDFIPAHRRMERTTITGDRPF